MKLNMIIPVLFISVVSVCTIPGCLGIEPGKLLPSKTVSPGWIIKDDVLEFPAVDMWKHINGGAEQYIDYGCTTLTAVYYGKTGSESEIAVEIYEMKDSVSGYGIYAIQRPPDATLLDIGTQGYQVNDTLNFYIGNFYIKMNVIPDDPDNLKAMLTLAEQIADTSQLKPGLPEILTHFPAKDLVENSIQYIPKAILGIRDTPPGFRATYRFGGAEVELYIIRLESSDEVSNTASLIRKSLEKRSQSPTSQLHEKGLTGFSLTARYQGQVFVLTRDNDLIIVKGSDDRNWVLDTSISLLKSL